MGPPFTRAVTLKAVIIDDIQSTTRAFLIRSPNTGALTRHLLASRGAGPVRCFARVSLSFEMDLPGFRQRSSAASGTHLRPRLGYRNDEDRCRSVPHDRSDFGSQRRGLTYQPRGEHGQKSLEHGGGLERLIPKSARCGRNSVRADHRGVAVGTGYFRGYAESSASLINPAG